MRTRALAEGADRVLLGQGGWKVMRWKCSYFVFVAAAVDMVLQYKNAINQSQFQHDNTSTESRFDCE